MVVVVWVAGGGVGLDPGEVNATALELHTYFMRAVKIVPSKIDLQSCYIWAVCFTSLK